MLLTNLNCEDCQENLEFSDEIINNNTNFSKEECDYYEISFIKKNINNNFEYTIIFICRKCESKINKTFKEKEANFHFKCKKCPLKGVNFSYFLSQEDDAYQKNDSINASHPKEDNVPQPLNSLSDLTPVISGNKKKGIAQPNEIFESNPYKNDKNEQNDKIDNPRNIIPSKIYSTPNEEEIKEKEEEKEEKIKVIFIKNKQKYTFYFKPSDSINNKINCIKQKIDLGNNPVFIYNSNEIDKNKSFRENKISNGFSIEIEEE